MINNLLDLARLEEGSRELELMPVQPENLLRAAADAFRARADDQAVELVLDMPQGLPEVAADAARLGRRLSGTARQRPHIHQAAAGRITLGAIPAATA